MPTTRNQLAADPLNASLRLVYADCLEELGDEERGRVGLRSDQVGVARERADEEARRSRGEQQGHAVLAIHRRIVCGGGWRGIVQTGRCAFSSFVRLGARSCYFGRRPIR